jgi:putative NIF3 family GTP cyclohydrolase 1 type 2
MAIKLGELYRMAIQLGKDQDPRDPEVLEADLRKVSERFERMEARDRDRFDRDALWNPYADSRLLHGDPETEVGGLLWGIDITPAEVLLADRLRERGRRIDAVLGHHPRGRAQANFTEVMHVMEYMLEDLGVPITVAEDILGPRIKEVARAFSPTNFDQAVDAARLLDMPMMCLHSCTDNLVQRYLVNYLKEIRPGTVADIIVALQELPEFERASRNNSPPDVLVGDKGRRAGKIMVKMTGGTSGPKEMYDSLAKAGVGTVVCMHVPENHIEEARKNHINIVISGHMPSDSLGINLLADKVEDRGVEIVPCSGFIRVRRT